DPAANINDPIERLSVSASHPLWLVDRWTKAFGAAETEALCHANNGSPPIAFRVVKRRTANNDVLSKLKTAGALITKSQIATDAWRFAGDRQLLFDLVAHGEVYLQDEASQLVPEILDARPDERILDLCAAPGSKTTQIADSMQGRGTVIAGDVYARRLQALRRSATLQNLENIQCLQLDALQALPFKEQSFDRVLVDAPCSGTGTLRRNPEIRWRISAHDIEDLSARQGQLLSNASRVVRPGGRLVYSTCSVEPDENEAVARTFIDNHINFSLRPMSGRNSLLMDGTLRTWPQHDGTDGFFVVAFERVN
ncbi:MAG TPA: methyltransferase domain-containing protein, partial [Pyrinomonadaceae bacterium]|nr:methyltransferase domain-containing protein [Pyrinomonadaceae bacterium]